MSDNLDLEQVITDSVNDAVSGVEDTPEVDSAPAVEAQPEPVASDDGTAEATGEELAPTQTQVAAPGAQTQEQPQEDPLGMPQFGVTGRENRIPYSRVKKISENAASAAEAKIAETVLGRKLNQGEKAVDAVKAFAEQLPQLSSKVQDYEGRLSTVGQFENVMANDPQRFLTMLAKLPAYKQFFNFVEQAYDTMSKVAPQGQAAPAQPGQQPAAQATPVTDDMPQPDEKLADGSSVYSMKGLQNLMAWTQAKAREQAVREASAQFDSRYKALENQYAPMLRAWQEHQTRQSVVPMIQAQIAEARTWPMFNELEGEITKVLEADKSISLEAAYRKVAFPKIMADRNSMRQNILQELKTAPTSTSVARPGARPLAPAVGPKSIEDVIRESVETLKGGNS